MAHSINLRYPKLVEKLADKSVPLNQVEDEIAKEDKIKHKKMKFGVTYK